MRRRIWPFILFTLVLPLALLFGQGVVTQDTVGLPKPGAVSDSSKASIGSPYQRVIAGRTDTLVRSYHSTKSTSLAMGLSAILPGAGQAYNESYWKVPIVLGLGIYFVSNWLDNNRRYLDYRDQYEVSKTQTPGGSSRLLAVREFYKDERDSFAWYFLILYFVNIADAYVDASLYDFSVGNDLSIRMMPGWSPIAGISTQLQLRITF